MHGLRALGVAVMALALSATSDGWLPISTVASASSLLSISHRFPRFPKPPKPKPPKPKPTPSPVPATTRTTTAIVPQTAKLSMTPAAARTELAAVMKSSSDDVMHVVPLKHRAHPTVQRAAKGGFNFNGVENGMTTSRYPSGYEELWKARLDGIHTNALKHGMSNARYASMLRSNARAQRRSLEATKLTTRQTKAPTVSPATSKDDLLRQARSRKAAQLKAAAAAVEATKISRTTQSRHIKGTPAWREKRGSYLLKETDAQRVLDDFHAGRTTLVTMKQSGPVIRAEGITGFHNSRRHGFSDQPTNHFIIKGTKNVSIVPTNPVL